MSTAGQPGLGASEAPQKYRSRSSSSSSSTSSSSAASSRSSSLTRHHNARGPSARAAQTNGSTAKPHVSMRDRIAAELHERFPSQAISGRVKCKVLNQTAYPLQVVAWPRKVRYVDKGGEDGEDSDIVLTTHRGTAFENEVLPSGTIIMPEQKGDDGQGFEAGSMRKAHSLQHHSHRGWIYLDLVKPGGETAIHLQLYLQLTRHGIKHQTSVGRLDLDSNSENPQPSGVVGRVVYEKKGDSVTFVITPEVGDIQNMVDDSTKKPSLLLLGKGVETTTYVHHAGSRINLFVGREARYHEHTQRIAVDDGRGSTQHGRLGEIRHTQHEVEGTSSKFVGICSQYLGRETFKAHVKVHAVTGIVEMGKGYLANTLRTRAVFQDASDSGGEPHVLCYGFSDVGASRSDAIYAYVTRVHEGWLGALIEEDKRWLDVPFSKLALAGAHDAGMWEALNPGLLFVIENGPLAEGLSDSALLDLGTPVVRAMVRALQKIKFKPERALQNLANTQKDDTATLLRLGVRFFDFRPGYNFYDAVQAEKKEIRHQHAIVPGEEYISFLTSILRFLAKNAHEVVLVELKKDGFVLPEDKFDKQGKKVAISMIPSVQELRACLDQAYVAAGRPDIRAGCAGDLDASIGSLIERQTRLIIVDRVHDPHAWYRSDSYDPAAYGTDNPATIMAQLAITHGLSSKADDLDSSPKRGCIYQLQATPTGNMVDAVKSALTFSDASSLLVWMKAQQDRVTYPWIASTEFDEPGNVVFLNDFCDGALVDHAIDVCRRRAGLFGPAQRSTYILRSGSKRSAFLEQ